MKLRISKMNLIPVAKIKKAELIATVTRADGTVEHLGVIASQDYEKKNIFHRLGEKLWRMI